MSEAGIFIYQIQSTTPLWNNTLEAGERVEQQRGGKSIAKDQISSIQWKRSPISRKQQDKQISPSKGRKPVKYLSRKKERIAAETSKNITAHVIERDTSGKIYYFLEDSRGFRTPQDGHQSHQIVRQLGRQK
ncbi:hypothetical protein TNCV_111801 [Trichonephila clavipes]|nr:hypothetical protein TNCV_111801 [Trichonephila clavipes]